MRPRRPRKKILAEINVVPYIDIMLVLLVIFMITAPLLSQGIHVDLPQTHAKKIVSSNQLPIIVSIDDHGNYFLNITDKPMSHLSESQLLTRVAAELVIAKQAHQPQPIYVKADQAVNYGKVVKLMAVLQQAGAEHIGLITQSPLQATN